MVQIKWNTDEITWELVRDIQTHDLHALLLYAKQKKLCKTKGLKWVKRVRSTRTKMTNCLKRMSGSHYGAAMLRRAINKPDKVKSNSRNISFALDSRKKVKSLFLAF